MAPSDVAKLIKFTIPFLAPYLLKRLLQRIGAFFHRFTYDPSPTPKHAIIIGGSFAGISLAKRLCETLPSGHKIILIEKNTHFHFLFAFPRFSVVKGHEAKAFIPYDQILDSGKNGVPLGIFERRRDLVVGVSKNSVKVASGEIIPFEFLAVATGTSSSLPSKLSSLDKHGSCEELRATQEKIMNAENIAVVGGGAVGVELVTDIKSWYPEKKVTMIHSKDRLVCSYGLRLHERTMEEMKKLDIEVLLGQRPAISVGGGTGGKSQHALAFPDGSIETFDLVMPCTGQIPNANIMKEFFPDSISEKTGRILVHSTLQVMAGDDSVSNIFALGDVAESHGPKMGRAAEAQSQIIASNIVSLINGSRATSIYEPIWELEGAIKLSLGKSALALYAADRTGDDCLISLSMGREDGDIKRGWAILGAKFDEAKAANEQ